MHQQAGRRDRDQTSRAKPELPGLLRHMLERRSVRDGYDATPIRQDVLNLIVECGLRAPSSKNAQPWLLHVVTDRSLIIAIADQVLNSSDQQNFRPLDPATGERRHNYQSSVSESASELATATAAIFIENRGDFTNNRDSVISAEEQFRRGAVIGFGLEYIGLGACMENMWLAAEALGLGASFMGDVLIAEQYIRQALGMVNDLVGVLALGYFSTGCGPKAIQDNVVWHG